MKQYLSFCILFFAISLNAATYTVSNNPAQDEADFVGLAEAIADANVNDGDILLVQGSGTSYGDITINKSITIYGPGFNIGGNPNTANLTSSEATLGNVTIASGTENVFISGTTITGNLTINGDNIVVQRNKIKAVRINDVDVIVLGQNGIYGVYQDCSTSQIERGGIYITGASSGVVHNNYIYGKSCSFNNDPISVEASGASSFMYRNNIFQYGASISNSTFENNIFIGGPIPSTNPSNGNQFYDNIFLSDISPVYPENGNVVNQGPMADVFELVSGTYLTYYQPVEGSIAITKDAGIFGGPEEDQFVPSGIPSIPQVYSLSTPTNATGDNLNVEVKAKTNN